MMVLAAAPLAVRFGQPLLTHDLYGHRRGEAGMYGLTERLSPVSLAGPPY